uniref:Uncharacterized protein n=1 Tax=Onchocerca volvulus TaxID=6282 RepID=A0A8R1XPC5_ONCVO
MEAKKKLTDSPKLNRDISFALTFSSFILYTTMIFINDKKKSNFRNFECNDLNYSDVIQQRLIE